MRLGNNSHNKNLNVAFGPQANQVGLFLNPKRVKGELTPFADELRESRKNPDGIVEASYTVVEDTRTRLNRERVQEQQRQSDSAYKVNFGPQNDPRVIEALQKQVVQMGQRLNRLEQLLTKNSNPNKASSQASYDAWGNRDIGRA